MICYHLKQHALLLILFVVVVVLFGFFCFGDIRIFQNKTASQVFFSSPQVSENRTYMYDKLHSLY